MGLQGLQEPLVVQVPLEVRDRQDQRVLRALQAFKDQRGRQVILVRLVIQVQPDQPVLIPPCLDQQALQDQLEQRVLLVLKVFKV